MFKEMAWLDEGLNFDNVTAEADVLSLPANVNINAYTSKLCITVLKSESSSQISLKR